LLTASLQTHEFVSAVISPYMQNKMSVEVPQEPHVSLSLSYVGNVAEPVVLRL
jgi:hypothetical protein